MTTNPGLMLEGVKVADFSALLPGPYGTVLLADIGADVIKIEPPRGDLARRMPFNMYRAVNRNKRTLCLDLKSPESRAVVRRLVEWADVVVEGSRPGVAKRLGIDAETVRAIKPGVVHCSISGFGQTGPLNQLAGHDVTYMAMSGALAYTSSLTDDRPSRSGLPVSDLSGSMYFSLLVVSALLRARTTGEGASIDLSLMETAMSFASVRGDFDSERPTRGYLYPGNDVFQTADDRWIALGLIEEHFWFNFVEAVSTLEPALRNPDYVTESGRHDHRFEITKTIETLMSRKTGPEWIALFEPHDVPAAIVLKPVEAIESPQIVARDLVRSIDGERHLPLPALVDGKPCGRLKSLAAAVGENNAEVLSELGFGGEEIASLERAGVTRPQASTREEAAQ